MKTRPLRSAASTATLTAATALVALGAGCADGIDPPAATAVVSIAAGSFEMGRADGDICGQFYTDDDFAFLPQNPRLETARAEHEVTVQRFCIDEHEVTVRQYDHCQQRGDCRAPVLTNAGNLDGEGFIARYYVEPDTYGAYPMLGVSWEQARDYCVFRGGRLPTESEWEYVASSRGSRKTQVWADPALTAQVDGDCAARAGEVGVGGCADRVAPVKSATADITADGVYDLAGNAAEWVADEFDFFAYCAPDQPGARLDELFELVEGRPQAIADAAFISDPDALVPADEGYEGTCIEAFDGCADRCGITFGGSGSPSTRASQWQLYACGARFGLAPRDVDACRRDMNCPPDVRGCFDTPPTAPADGKTCLARCQTEVDACIVGATVEGATTACVQYDNTEGCKPVAWCVPREGWVASTVHLRPDALTNDELRGAHTVRGGHFATTAACRATPTWRDFRKEASPLIGFRCAYDAGTARCPERP